MRIEIYFQHAGGFSAMWSVRADAFYGILRTQGLPSEIERIKRVEFPGQNGMLGSTWQCPDGMRDEQAMMLQSLLKPLADVFDDQFLLPSEIEAPPIIPKRSL